VDVLRLDGAARRGSLHHGKFRLWLEARFHAVPPFQVRSAAAQPDERERGGNGGPEDNQTGPIMIRERGQGPNGHQDQRDPFRLNPQQHFDVRKNRSEGDEDAEVKRGGTGEPEPCPETGDGEKERRHPEKQSIKDNERAAAEQPFQFPAEHEKHVHFHREPEQSHAGIRQVHKGVGHDLPDATEAQDLGAIEDEETEDAGGAEG
jgi:hypothetical protein